MTLIQTFTDSFAKDNLVFFSDFIGDAKPFGIVRTSNAIGTPTIAFANDNSDGSLGTLTATTPTGTPGGAIYARAGVYQSVDLTGSLISRSWDIGKGEYEMEARLKSSMDRGTYLLTCGYSLNHNTTNTAVAEAGAFFYHYGNQTTWRAAVMANYVTLKEIDTGVSCKSFAVLRVQSLLNGTKFNFYVNDMLVMKWIGADVAAAATASSRSMPCIELRDRTAGGSGFSQSFIADYMLTKERLER